MGTADRQGESGSPLPGPSALWAGRQRPAVAETQGSPRKPVLAELVFWPYGPSGQPAPTSIPEQKLGGQEETREAGGGGRR